MIGMADRALGAAQEIINRVGEALNHRKRERGRGVGIDPSVTPLLLKRLPEGARRDLLRVLTSPSNVRADVIRQFHERGEEGMVEVCPTLRPTSCSGFR